MSNRRIGPAPASPTGAEPVGDADASAGTTTNADAAINAGVATDDTAPHSSNGTIDERFGRCPYATAQKLIGGKWAVLIMHYLALGPTRFNELERLMPKMSPATLSAQLKALTAYGLVSRTQLETMPPAVEYSLTDIGQEFTPVLQALDAWGEKYISYLRSR